MVEREFGTLEEAVALVNTLGVPGISDNERSALRSRAIGMLVRLPCQRLLLYSCCLTFSLPSSSSPS